MKIHVEMTPEEFDQFRQYQMDKETARRDGRLAAMHDRLCAAIVAALDAPSEPAPPPLPPGILVKDERMLLDAYDLATEWLYG